MVAGRQIAAFKFLPSFATQAKSALRSYTRQQKRWEEVWQILKKSLFF